MTEQHAQLIDRAKEKHSKIQLLGFTEEEGKLMLWYNDKEDSTHMEACNVN